VCLTDRGREGGGGCPGLVFTVEIQSSVQGDQEDATPKAGAMETDEKANGN